MLRSRHYNIKWNTNAMGLSMEFKGNKIKQKVISKGGNVFENLLNKQYGYYKFRIWTVWNGKTKFGLNVYK